MITVSLNPPECIVMMPISRSPPAIGGGGVVVLDRGVGYDPVGVVVISIIIVDEGFGERGGGGLEGLCVSLNE